MANLPLMNFAQVVSDPNFCFQRTIELLNGWRFSDSWNFVEIDEIDDLRGNSWTIELSRYGFNEIMCGDFSSSRILNQLGGGFKEFFFSSRFLGR